MTHSSVTELLRALKDELLAVSRFVELLQQEQTLLTENNTDQLVMLAETKSANAIRLNELAESRRTLMSKNLAELTTDTINAWLETHSAEGLSLWLKIRALAQQAQQMNHINGELIQMKLRHNQQSLVALNGAVSKANLYGPDGQASFVPGSGRSLGSV